MLLRRKQLKKIKGIVQVVVLVGIVFLFVAINIKISKSRDDLVIVGEDDENCVYQFENMSIEEDELVLHGWFFRMEEVKNVFQNITNNTNRSILLINIDPNTGEIIYDDEEARATHRAKGICLVVESENRKDVNEYFWCDYDYSHSGFTAKGDLSDIDLENDVYRIVIKEDSEKSQGMLTNTYIYKGQLFYSNPITTQQLDIEGTDLEKIVNEGTCLVSRPEYHCNIYQYGWKLYWIVDEEFDFDENAATPLVYMMNTTQFTHLPAVRTNNGWYWGNAGKTFEAYEITDTMNCGKYRVSVRDIPNGYSITTFSLGCYENGERIWDATARPHYDFSVIPDPTVYGYLGDDVADWMKQ